MKTKQRVLIIDDDLSFIEPVTLLLTSAGYDVRSAQNSLGALDIVRREAIGLALLDLRLGKESGLEVLVQLKAMRPEMSVIVITALGTIEAAVEAMRRGADNFIEKPVDPPKFLAIIAKGLESRQLRRKQAQLERLVPQSQPLVLGEGSAMNEAIQLAEAVAARDTTVLLRGETGTGKGLLARWIHEASPRKKEPFVHLNCAGLQRELTESELFGHERGAFTGAVEKKIGLFEAADGGTLFLDEIGEMDPAVQSKLLNVLEQKQFRRVGGLTEIEADVRVIAATHRDLEQDVAAGRFREDLFYRLSVFSIEMAPLRDRPEDILPLARHFLEQSHSESLPISAEAEKRLLAYNWPGNVRELKNVIERAAILCPADAEILPAHLPAFKSRIDFSPSASPSTMEDAERQHLEAALRDHHWNLTATARALGVSRDTLYRKIKKYGISQ